MSLFLPDTNILLRSAQPQHPQHSIAKDAVEYLCQNGDKACLVTQNLVEFRAVCTRPISVNGLGMTHSKVREEIDKLKSLFYVLEDKPAIQAEWERLVDIYGAEGKQNHDARLAACMVVHGISKILTFNKEDFVRYPELIVVTPQEVCATR